MTNVLRYARTYFGGNLRDDGKSTVIVRGRRIINDVDAIASVELAQSSRHTTKRRTATLAQQPA
jgi:hypothetical protein